MLILLCFPFYKECPVYFRIKDELKAYNGPHEFILSTCQGTIIHDSRNQLITRSTKISRSNPKLVKFDASIWFDSDIDAGLEDALHLISLKKDNVGLPYALRGHKTLYNAGFIENGDHKHLPITEKGLKKVGGQGMGARFISRKVFENIEPFWFWPDIIDYNGKIESIVEDWSFDIKSEKAGFPVWCDFDKPVNHNIGEPQMEEKEPKQIDLFAMSKEIQKISLSANRNISDLQAIAVNLIEVCQNQGVQLSNAVDRIKELEAKEE